MKCRGARAIYHATVVITRGYHMRADRNPLLRSRRSDAADNAVGEDPSAAGARLAYRYVVRKGGAALLMLAAVAVSATSLIGVDPYRDGAVVGTRVSAAVATAAVATGEPYDERDLQLYMQRRRRALLNDSSVMSLGQVQDLPEPSRSSTTTSAARWSSSLRSTTSWSGRGRPGRGTSGRSRTREGATSWRANSSTP